MFMTAASAIAVPADRTRLRVATLDHWAEAGLALLEKLISDPGRGVVDGLRRLTRIAQAVRLAVVLAMRLADPADPGFRPAPAPAPAPADAPSPRAAEAKIRAERAPTDRPDRFLWEPLSDDAILRRPLPEIVKMICRALGVTFDPSLWSGPDAPGEAPVPEALAKSPAPGPRPPAHLVPIAPVPRRPVPDVLATPPPDRSLLARLRSTCAPGALFATAAPLATLASGRLRLAGA